MIFHVQSINYVPHQAIKINVRKNRIWIDFGNFGHARHRKKKNKTKTQHTTHKTKNLIFSSVDSSYNPFNHYNYKPLDYLSSAIDEDYVPFPDAPDLPDTEGEIVSVKSPIQCEPLPGRYTVRSSILQCIKILQFVVLLMFIGVNVRGLTENKMFVGIWSEWGVVV